MNRFVLCSLLVSVFQCYPIASPSEEYVALPACLESNNISTIIDYYRDDIRKRVTSAIEECDSDQQLEQSAHEGNVPAMFALSKCNMDHNFVLPAYEWLVRGILVLKRDFACLESPEKTDLISDTIAGGLLVSFETRRDKSIVTSFNDMQKRTLGILRNVKELPADPSWLQSKYLTLCDEKKWPELRAAALEQFRQEHNDYIDSLN